MMRLSFPTFDPLHRNVAVAIVALASSGSAAVAALVEYRLAEQGALALSVIAAAVLLAGLMQRARTGPDDADLRAADAIAACCEEVKNGNLDATLADLGGERFADIQVKINDMVGCCKARVEEATSGLNAVVEKIATVSNEIRKGNFEARITNVTEPGALGDVQSKLNDMIDCCDAFVREATASLDAVCRGVYYRQILPGGLQGSLRVAADMINGSIETQAKAVEKARTEAEAQQARIVGSLAQGLKNLAEGNLTFRIRDLPEAYAQVSDDFNGAMAQLQETIQAVATAAQEVSTATAEISISTTDLSQRTEEQAASLEQTSAAMEQMAATVKKNAESAQQASDTAGSTRGAADRGGQVVAQAIDAMARIEESSNKVSDIMGVIDEIARQTNLLALNAAVEAARAGDAGRGFAVVASEVRNLAQRSAQAAKDVKDLITTSDGHVKNGAELVRKTGASLSEIVESIKGIADVIREIASASAEQASGVEQVNKALIQMDGATQQNSALVEENAATARTLEDQAKVMGERVAIFRLQETETRSADVVHMRRGSASAA
jgi:methyl-accepting chemotaxis protein